MSVSTHNLWKKKKNGQHKLVRSHKAWKKASNRMKLQTKLEQSKREKIG